MNCSNVVRPADDVGFNDEASADFGSTSQMTMKKPSPQKPVGHLGPLDMKHEGQNDDGLLKT